MYFDVTMADAWVWDIYRPARFVKNVRVVTFKDVNVEELAKSDLELPKTGLLSPAPLDASSQRRCRWRAAPVRQRRAMAGPSSTDRAAAVGRTGRRRAEVVRHDGASDARRAPTASAGRALPARAGHDGPRPQLAVRASARSTSSPATATASSSARSRPAGAGVRRTRSRR